MNNHQNYWSRRTRSTRRRFLGGTGALGAGAAGLMLVGCGGDDDDDNGNGNGDNGSGNGGNGNGDNGTPTESPSGNGDTSNGSSTGGIVRAQIGVAPTATLDPLISAGPAGTHHSMSLNRLLKYQTSADDGAAWASYALEGDLAESWEWADELTLTFKLRNAMTHDKEPLNGRRLTAEDCKSFFERYMEDGLEAAEYSIVDSVDAPDEETLTFHVTEPRVYFQSVFAYPGASWITPPEILDDDNLRENSPFGAGPFMLERYEPEVGFFYTKHPDFYDSELPNVDEAELYIIGEPQTIVSNLRSGELDFATHVPATQVGQFEESDDFRVLVTPSPWATTLGVSPATWTNDQPPFNDRRVRQAVQLGLDIEGMIEAAYGGRGARTGPVVPASARSTWGLPDDDPVVQDWLTYKPDEARALLEEAGYDGEEVPIHYNLGYGSEYGTTAEAIAASLSAVGFNTRLQSYQDAQWDSDVYFNDQWNGLAMIIFPAFPDIGAIVSYHMDPSTTTISISNEFPDLIDSVREQSVTTDTEERIALTQDVLRTVTEEAYFPPYIYRDILRVVSNRVENFHNTDHYAMGRDTVARLGIQA